MKNKILVTTIATLISTHAFADQISENFEKELLKNHKGRGEIQIKSNRIAKNYKSKANFLLASYKQNYFLPFSYSSEMSDSAWNKDGESKDIEALFQISVKYPVVQDLTPYGGDLYFAYTNKSNWQIYSKSSPFREITHTPEIFLDFKQDWDVLGIQNTNILTGLSHQTNGQSGNSERSWDRAFVDLIFAKSNYSFSTRFWLPISSEQGDQTKDIQDYYGYYELNGRYYLGNITLSGMTRYSFSEGKGALQLGASYPITESVGLYVEAFNGYGDTLIDYNRSNTRIGFGVTFTNDLF